MDKRNLMRDRNIILREYPATDFLDVIRCFLYNKLTS
jgi:hypothetical protein